MTEGGAELHHYARCMLAVLKGEDDAVVERVVSCLRSQETSHDLWPKLRNFSVTEMLAFPGHTPYTIAIELGALMALESHNVREGIIGCIQYEQADQLWLYTGVRG